MKPDLEIRDFEEIDLKEIVSVILKWKWLIISLVIVAVLSSGILSYFVLAPVYETKSVLMVAHSTQNQKYTTNDHDNLEGVVKSLSALPEMTMNTYVGQIKNSTLLTNVIKKLNLDDEGYTVGQLSGMISTHIIPDTNLVELKVSSTDPKKATIIANTLSEEFINFISSTNKERMTQSLDVLNEQLEVIEKDSNLANEILREFNSRPRSIIFLQEELNSKLADLTKFKSELIETNVIVDQMAAGIKETQNAISNTKPSVAKETVQEDAVDPLTGSPISTVTKVEERNPIYGDLQIQLNNQKNELASMVAKAASLSKVVVNLESQIGALQSELTGKQNDYKAILRDVERLDRNHEVFTERMIQTQIFQSIDIGDTNILIAQPAMEPVAPFKPNKKLNIAIAFVLALMVGIFTAFILEFFDNNIKNVDDVKRHLDLPVIGQIPIIVADTPKRTDLKEEA